MFGIILRVLLLISLTVLSSRAFAVPVANIEISVDQPTSVLPGGVSFRLHSKGDERANWYETDEGYSVVKDEKTKAWHYGTLDSHKKLQPSGKLVGRDLPQNSGFEHHLHSTPNDLAQQTSSATTSTTSTSVNTTSAITLAVTAPVTGTLPVLFILVDFSDQKHTYPASDFANLLTNQLQVYFNEVSYGRVKIVPATEISGTSNDGVIEWVTLPYNHPNTAGATGLANQQLAADAIKAADGFVDYASYDSNTDGYVDSTELAIVVVAAGYETAFGGTTCSPTPSLWGHQWNIPSTIDHTVDNVLVGDFHNGAGGYAQFGEIQGLTPGCNSNKSATLLDHLATVGIMAHELGHLLFGLPDLYDTTGVSEGIGNFSLMAAGSWGRKAITDYQGQSPVHPDAWCKLNLGWVDAITDTKGLNYFLAAGNYPTTTATNAVYLQTTSDPKQYFLIENRGQSGFDAGLSGLMTGSSTVMGLAVWHIDESVRTTTNWMAPNNSASHKFIDLEEADNVSTMDTKTDRGQFNDLYFFGNRTIFDDLSTPNSKLFDGTFTGVALNSILEPAATMSANFGIAPQTITFNTPSSLIVGASRTLTAIASSGLAVTFSSQSSTCTVSGAIVTAISVGTCIIAANQSGDNIRYTAAAEVTNTISIVNSKVAQTITFVSPTPTSLIGTNSGTLAATATLTPITFTVTPSTVCKVSGTTVTGVGAGTCTVTATQAGDATYASATKTQTITIAAKTAQTITFVSPTPTSLIGTNSGTLAATATLTPITFTVTPSTVCKVSGTTVTGVGAGTCTVTATQAGDATYASATKTQTITIAAKTAQTITTFTAPTSLAKAASGALTGAASSGLVVTFTSTTTTICKVNGTTVTATSTAGTCTVAADQSGNATYAAAPQKKLSISVK